MGSNKELVNFEVLYKRWSGMMHQYALYFVKDEEAAASLVNDLFVQLWFNKTSPDNLKGYLFRAIKNSALNYLKQYKNNSLTLLEQDDLTAISDLSFADEVTSESEQLVFLHFLISKLPERRQLVFKMHRIEGFSYAEIAELLQISVRTVEDHLSKSMQFIYDRSQHLIHRKLTEA